MLEETFETQSIDVETGEDGNPALAGEFDGSNEDLAVLLEDEPRVWDGFWTDDPERVVAIDEATAREF